MRFRTILSLMETQLVCVSLCTVKYIRKKKQALHKKKHLMLPLNSTITPFTSHPLCSFSLSPLHSLAASLPHLSVFSRFLPSGLAVARNSRLGSRAPTWRFCRDCKQNTEINISPCSSAEKIRPSPVPATHALINTFTLSELLL